ncbi:MAG: ATP-binding protein [Acutalibacteraceae bacterium]
MYDRLVEWKKRDAGKTALLIEGARRVGKTSLVREFGKHEYKTVAFIDFFKAPKAVIKVFEDESDDIAILLKRLSATLGIRFYPRETLIVFDEVQFYPRARGLVKYLVEDGRYDYIETGSLISIRKNVNDIVIPSEERSLRLDPMDFEEFLWALGDEAAMPYAKDCFESVRPLGAGAADKIWKCWREYLLVGGMPQAVAEFVESRDFARVDATKRGILKLYRNDMAKAPAKDESKIAAIFDSMPSQLSRSGGAKSYRLSELDKAARMREYEDAFHWLEEAHIVTRCVNTTDPSDAGLSKSEEYTTFKAFMCDTGLLTTHAFFDAGIRENSLYEAILEDRLGVNEGMLAENAVAQALRSRGRRLFFYSRANRDDRAERMEVDFLTSRDGKTSPIEVKSGDWRHHRSLDKFRAKFGERLGPSYILYTKDVMEKDGIIHLPLYMAMFL